MSIRWALVLIGAACVIPTAESASRREREVDRVLRLEVDLEAGERRYEASCAACHGAGGAGQYQGPAPRLAGQRFAVLVDQLVGFRLGRRQDGGMQAQAADHRLEAQALADIAGYVAQSSAAPPMRGPGAMPDVGARLFSDRCSQCHGASGEGADRPPVPRIATQISAYLLRQLRDFREGRRPDPRREHASRLEALDPAEVGAIADHLSRR